jgi:hypothetical protein
VHKKNTQSHENDSYKFVYTLWGAYLTTFNTFTVKTNWSDPILCSREKFVLRLSLLTFKLIRIVTQLLLTQEDLDTLVNGASQTSRTDILGAIHPIWLYTEYTGSAFTWPTCLA